MRVEPLTEDRWADVETLFGPNGAVGGCWCMYFRLTGAEFSAGCRDRGALNRAALRELVGQAPPGLLAYDDEDAPVGWCAVALRTEYGRILRSPTTKPTDPDDEGVWAITCFYIRRGQRRAGIASELLSAAVAYAKERGARAVEGYPIDTGGTQKPSPALYYGTVAMFRTAGFSEVDRRSEVRPIMRHRLTFG